MTSPTRLDRLSQIILDNNHPKFRIEQIKTAIYHQPQTQYSEINNLPKNLKTQIEKELGPNISTLNKISEISSSQTTKLLFETIDGHQIESVLLTYQPNSIRTTPHTALCLSTQSGCALGCTFCATGALGFKSNLSSDEIVDQLLYFTKQSIKVDSIIFMGMGEPLANADNVFEAIKLIIDPRTIGMSPRRVCISTVGIVPAIDQMTQELPQINLAISLHSAIPEKRRIIMPITDSFSIDQIFSSVDRYIHKSNHKVFISYLLLKGFNDSPADAQALVKLIKSNQDRQRLCHVNLIRYNQANTTIQYDKSSPHTIATFRAILNQNHIKNTLRQDFGTDINAACGQLAANYQKQ